MPRRAFALLPITAVVLHLLAVTDARAAAQRTFVASNGDDANPCSLVLPCRSFGAAITQTFTNGEVIVIDSAGYGVVDIDKAISIIAPPGIYAGITSFFGAAVNVHPTFTQGPVVLRNLTITGLGTFYGIFFDGGDDLLLDGVSVSGYTQVAIRVSSTATGTLIIRNSIVENNGQGISMDTSGGLGTGPKMSISNSLFAGNTTALALLDNTSASIADSTITGGETGISLNSNLGAGYVECIRCTISHVGTAIRATKSLPATEAVIVLTSSSISDCNDGIYTNAAIVRASDTTITHNATDIDMPLNGGQAISWGNNRLFGNGVDGSFTSIAPMQ